MQTQTPQRIWWRWYARFPVLSLYDRPRYDLLHQKGRYRSRAALRFERIDRFEC